MCVRLRLSAITLCWAARAVNALQVAFKSTQGPTATASPDSAVASRGLGAGSAIAVLQVFIASLTVYLATATKAVSQLMCATQTQGDVSARKMLPASSAIPVGMVPSILTPPTLTAVPAASASERLTGVRAPLSAGESLLRCRPGVWKAPTRRRLHLC